MREVSLERLKGYRKKTVSENPKRPRARRLGESKEKANETCPENLKEVKDPQSLAKNENPGRFCSRSPKAVKIGCPAPP